MNEKTKFFLDMILVSIISLSQSLSLVIFNGIKPNLILAVLVVLIFSEKSFWRYTALVMTSLVFLNYSTAISKEIIIFGLLMILAFYFKKYLSENLFLYSFLLTSILTTVFYLLIDARFVINNLNLFFWEIFYNVLISLIFGFLYQIGHEKQ
ncbi:MAG: hypothetical protein ACYC3G_01885 [Minisyncoccota bacterium]